MIRDSKNGTMSALNMSFNFELNYDLLTIETICVFFFILLILQWTRSIYRDANLRIASKFRIEAADAAMHKTNFYFHWNQGSNSILSMEKKWTRKKNHRWRCEVTRNWCNKRTAQMDATENSTQIHMLKLTYYRVSFIISTISRDDLLSHIFSYSFSNPFIVYICKISHGIRANAAEHQVKWAKK